MKNKMNHIVKNYGCNVKSVIRSIMGHNNEDLEQEVYIKTWKNMSNYKEEGKLHSWIKRITVNTCKDYFKSKEHKANNQIIKNEELLMNISDNKSSAESKLIKNERHKSIMLAINSLKPKYKEVILLFDIYELSYEDISKKINCPVGTVKSRLFNARKILQNELKDFLKGDFL